MKKWQSVYILCGVAKGSDRGNFPSEYFYRRVAKLLNKWEVQPGEVFVHPPVQIRDTTTYKAVLLVYSDKEIPPSIAAGPTLGLED